jgi:prolyl oligopeptidase
MKGLAALAAAATLAVMAAALAVAGAAHAADSSAPPSARNVVTDTYHGVQVSDPYRWLEDSADPKVHDWSVAEDKRTRQYLDALPQRDRIYRQLLAQISATSSSYHGLYAAGGQVFALYDEPAKQHPMIAVDLHHPSSEVK